MSGESGVSKAEFQALLLVVEGLQKRVAEFELVVTEPSSAAASVAEAATSLTAERLGAARLIGAWIRRGLRGEPRGLSGREKISLASRFYIVVTLVRDFDLVNYNPPRVFSSWGEAKTLTHRLGQPGDSIFVGVPSRAEVRAVCAAADLETPAAFRQ